MKSRRQRLLQPWWKADLENKGGKCVWKKDYRGNPVSEGIAYAKSYIYIPGTLTKAPDFFPKGQEEEKYREFRESCEKADSELVTLYNGMCKEDPDKAKIFSAHRELLQDEEILDEIRETICEENMNPDSAVSKVYTEFAELLAGVEDPLIAERAADLRDVRDGCSGFCRGRKRLSCLRFRKM